MSSKTSRASTCMAPEWGPPLGGWLGRIVESGAHHGAVDLGIDTVAAWLAANQASFSGLVSRRLPAWVPSIAAAPRRRDRLQRGRQVRRERCRTDPKHPARIAIDGYLDRLADNLQHDPADDRRDSRRRRRRCSTVRGCANSPAEAWNTAKAGLLEVARRPAERSASRAPLRRSPRSATRLTTDAVAPAPRRQLGDRRRGVPGRPVSSRHRDRSSPRPWSGGIPPRRPRRSS